MIFSSSLSGGQAPTTESSILELESRAGDDILHGTRDEHVGGPGD